MGQGKRVNICFSGKGKFGNCNITRRRRGKIDAICSEKSSKGPRLGTTMVKPNQDLEKAQSEKRKKN